MKQEIIADLSRITEEEQAILDGKTEVEKERYSSGQKFVMDAGKLLERGKLIDIRPHTRFMRFPAHSHHLPKHDVVNTVTTIGSITGIVQCPSQAKHEVTLCRAANQHCAT